MFLRMILLAALAFLPATAQSQTRIALLIGNQSYDASVGVLKNPHNDITLVGDALKTQGFQILPLVKDAKRSSILGGVRDLVSRLKSAEKAGEVGAIGFVYYSGHGAAEKETNINYLIPIDAKDPGAPSFWDESIKLDEVLKLLEGARSAAKFVIFDACRNELQLPTKDTTKGLVPIVEQKGMFIAYASAPGRTASDRGERSGPYAAALAAEIKKPGADHLNLFQNVKEAVYSATGGVQQPWESNGLLMRVYLSGTPKTGALAVKFRDAETAWSSIKTSSDLKLLHAFAERYADTLFADLANRRIAELKRELEAASRAWPMDAATVKATFGDWQVVCRPPQPDSNLTKEICATIQSVTAEDRKNVGLTVYFQKSSNGTRMLRVFAPLGILMPPGLGLKIDNDDIGHAPFLRCQSFACFAQVVVEEDLFQKLSKGNAAVFIIYQTEDSGIGIPISLAGFADAARALERL